MSAISSRAPELPTISSAPNRWLRRLRLGTVVDVAIAVFVTGMMGLMVARPGHEAGPYHIMFLAIAIAYGYRIWPVVPTAAVTVVITLLSGWLMVTHASEGALPQPELAEIPLMPLVLLTMVWHARRRVAAVQQMEQMATRQLSSIEREREFFRDASHAIRTPVTIARGHLELATAQDLPGEVQSDLDVALRQLDRMSALSNRLLALAHLDSGDSLSVRPTDVAELVCAIGDNWATGVERVVTVRASPTGPVPVDPEWIEMVVDALMENAVHFTADGGAINLTCWRSGTTCTIIVADSGPGIPAGELPQVFDRFWHRMPPNGPMGTGLGLSMAKAATLAHGGTLTVRNGSTGGAVFTLTLRADGKPF